jgi:hypothetical protein
MHSSDITIHKAIVHNVSNAGVYVKIPSLLGASEVIALHEPSISDYRWPPPIGDQILVAVEGDNFNRVYAILNVNNQPDNTFEIADGSITTSKIADGSVTTAKIANDAITTDKIVNNAVTTAKIANGSVTTDKLGFSIPSVNPTTLKVRRVSSQSIPGLTATMVSFDTEDSDSSGLVTVPSTTITIPTGMGGTYALSSKVTRVSGSAAIGVSFRVSNTQNLFEVAPGSSVVWAGGMVYLVDGDTIQLRIESNSTVSVTAILWMTRIMD